MDCTKKNGGQVCNGCTFSLKRVFGFWIFLFRETLFHFRFIRVAYPGHAPPYPGYATVALGRGGHKDRESRIAGCGGKVQVERRCCTFVLVNIRGGPVLFREFRSERGEGGTCPVRVWGRMVNATP